MSEPVYSLVFDREAASGVFKQVGRGPLLLAVLASVGPDPDWEGCLVYDGETPLDGAKTACLGIRGPAAETVQQRLVEAMERIGIPILQLYEGGPEVREPIAQVREGRWASAREDR